MVTGAQATNGDSTGLNISEPPPDLVQTVTIAAPPALAAAAEAGEQDLRISEQPPDVTQPNTVAEQPPAIAALLEAAAADTAWADELGPLDTQAAYRIVRAVAATRSGDSLYSAVSSDDASTMGLRFGLVLWPQISRHFGSALRLMQARDRGRFAEIMGPAADELIAVTSSVDPAARLAPVGGEPLTSPAWVERVRAAGAIEAFQAAQNEEAIEHQLRPVANVAFALGHTGEDALQAAYQLVVAHGLGEGIRRLVASNGSGAGRTT